MTFRHRAGVTTYTSHCWFADGCVFDKQSPGPAFCRSSSVTTGATLLPKLRVHFAEFLNASSLVRLRFLIPPTCVRLRYGSMQPCLRQCFPAPWLRPLRLDFLSARLQLTSGSGFACPPLRLADWTGTTVALPDLASCVLPSKLHGVSDSRPISHRLRVSASP